MKTAHLQYSPEGVPYSGEFDDIYHSTDGGLGQAHHVFMAGNRLPERWREQDAFTILETGFGLGLSFLATWQAWKNDPQRSQRLHFVSVEKFPFTAQDLAQLHRQWPQFSEISAELIAKWPWLTPGFQRIELDHGRVILTLLLGDALEWLPKLVARVDAIYLDGFAPSKNPDMWSLRLFKLLWRISHSTTTLATYTVAGAVRRGLSEAGFTVERIAGFGGKRQMLIGHTARNPRPRQTPHQGPKHAIVIGAGLAGCGVAERLAARGWQITVLDAADQIASGASGNHIGLMHPALSLDDNALARLSRAGFAGTLAHLSALTMAGQNVGFACDGILQMAKDAPEAQRMADIMARHHFPADYAQFLTPETTRQRFNIQPQHGAWWFARGTWINPASLCQANLQRWPKQIHLSLNTTVTRLEKRGTDWHALDEHGRNIASAPIVVLANATAANRLLPEAPLPLSDGPRCVTRLPDHVLPELPFSLVGMAYCTASYQGWRCIGAAEVVDDNLICGEAQNLAELGQLLPDWIAPEALSAQTRFCKRPNSQDRLPLIGALPAPIATADVFHQLDQIPCQDGLFGVLGLGARGLTWTWLAGEILACQLSGEPLPIDETLLKSVTPARFILRRTRKPAF